MHTHQIRINPGNFADGRKTFEEINYDDPAQFEAERAEIEEVRGLGGTGHVHGRPVEEGGWVCGCVAVAQWVRLSSGAQCSLIHPQRSTPPPTHRPTARPTRPQAFTPLVLKCKELGRAMRIGTNHGSLSARILSFYGDTPRGMVESAFEFAEICRKHDYHNFLFSMKASNPLVMVSVSLTGRPVLFSGGWEGGREGGREGWSCAALSAFCPERRQQATQRSAAPAQTQPPIPPTHTPTRQAYRLLAEEMYAKGWDYPLHLGVTEAGEGEDGRMKSAIGIGALLMDGLGDTIR